MKRSLLVLLMAGMVWPCISQNTTPPRGTKKHSPATAVIHNLIPERSSEKKTAKFDFYESGVLSIRNNAMADSIMMYGHDYKAENWGLISKQIPMYYEGTFLLKELETWYKDDWDKEYFPGEKLTAAYDGKGRITRIETHYWNEDQWLPVYASEMQWDIWEEEVLYAEYYFDPYQEQWILDYGYRAVDDLNDNGMLVTRLWEYYDSWSKGWAPEFKEVYVRNEDGVIVEIIEYEYDEWDETWENDIWMVFDLCENNTWASGYSYNWDWEEEVWFPALKYEHMSWYDFDQMKVSGLMVMANPAVYEDWDDDDWDKNATDHEDIEWINYMKIHAEYTAEGLLSQITTYLEYDEYESLWVPAHKNEMAYDHYQNLVYEVFSMYDEAWIMIEGFSLNMEYNDDQSVKAVEFSMVLPDWKGNMETFYRFEYYYSDGVTSVPVVPVAEPLHVFPNPASSNLQLIWPGSDDRVNITIIGMDGKIVSRYEQYPVFSGQSVNLDVSNLNNGLYIIQCENGQTHKTARFLKK